jgi:xanthine dehydrogenase small subunit
LLDHLRLTERSTGTKEGCAEGDCGACTVVIASLVDGELEMRNVNSCIQFLPTLDGKELITVENLRGADGSLHPVQQAMVDCHGSQCGFCTPGFVMSLFALYKSVDRPTRAQINDAIAGNLCRCTGYRPIVEAAQRMYDYGSEARNADDHWMNCSFSSPGDRQPSRGEREMIERLRSIERRDTLALAHGARRYFAPTRLAELAALREAHPDARILAGGTDVGLWVTKQYRDLREIIYVGNVAELAEHDRARAAIALGAALLGAGAAAVLAQVFEDRARGVDVRDLGDLAVEDEADGAARRLVGARRCHASPPAIRRRRSWPGSGRARIVRARRGLVNSLRRSCCHSVCVLPTIRAR